MSLLLMAVFSGWLFLASTKAWRQARADAHAIDVLLARAATIVIPIIIVHSVFDYPLRTDAMMAVLALSCALLVEPLKFIAKKDVEPQFARAQFASAGEVRLQLAPVREISEEEKRRLARLKGETALEDFPELLEAPRPRLLDSPDETTSGLAIETGEIGAEERDPYDQLSEYVPVDLDEVADHPERYVAKAPDMGAPRRLFSVPQEQWREPVHDAPLQVLDDAEQPSEPAFDPRSPAPVDSAGKAGAATENVGDMAYTLAQFNRLSAVLMARSEAATTQVTESGRGDGAAGVPTNRFAEVAERRMKVLHSVKLVGIPGAPREPAEPPRPAAPQRPPTAEKISDASAAQPLEPAQRRLRALRAVESFIQTTELAAADPTASLEISEPASGSGDAEPTVQFDRAHESSPNHGGDAGEPDLLSASAPAASEEVVGYSGPLLASNQAPTPLAAPEDPDAAGVASEVPAQLLEAEPQDDAVEPTIGTEVFAELVEPMAQSARTAPDQAALAQQQVPAAVEPLRPPEAPQPQTQWSDDIEWPQQWRPDSGGNATVMPSPAQQQDIDDEPLAAAEPAALENTVRTPEDVAPPIAAPAEPNRSPEETAEAPIPAPAAKPRRAAPAPAATFAELPALPDKSRWGDDIEWPEEWRK